jgi:hypothetical protein
MRVTLYLAHWEYQSLLYLQVPSAHRVTPVHPFPPHCPQSGTVPPLRGGLLLDGGSDRVDGLPPPPTLPPVYTACFPTLV